MSTIKEISTHINLITIELNQLQVTQLYQPIYQPNEMITKRIGELLSKRGELMEQKRKLHQKQTKKIDKIVI